MPSSSSNPNRFQLVTGAYGFVLTALPLRHPESRLALHAFEREIQEARLPECEIDAILLKVLRILMPHTRGRLPTLVDRYLTARDGKAPPRQAFTHCIQETLSFIGIGDRDTQRIIESIDDHFCTASFSILGVATEIGMPPKAVAARLRTQTGRTFAEHVRFRRLSRAAEMLAKEGGRVKEIWVRVGYNDASNFVHDFKAYFGVPPREYRQLWIERQAATVTDSPTQSSRTCTVDDEILIVDDDLASAQSLRVLLRNCGYEAGCVATGREALELVSTAPAIRGIVLDYFLPDMNGVTWLEALNGRPLKHRPSVIVFSAALELAEDVGRLARLGAAYVSKLSDPIELVRTLESNLQVSACGFGPAPQPTT